MRFKQHCAAVAVSLGLALAGTAQAAVISNFGPTDNQQVAQSTGDITGVNVIWTNVCRWNSGYGDLVNVGFAGNPCTTSGPMGEINFDADAGFRVRLGSFDMSMFGTSGGNDGAVRVLDEANNILFSGAITNGGIGHVSFAPNLTSTVGGQLRIQFDVGATPDFYVGIDNINFEAVPEPATLVLLGLGLAGLGFSRRKLQA